MNRHLACCGALLAVARLSAALSVTGKGDGELSIAGKGEGDGEWPWGTTTSSTSTAAPVHKTAEERAEAAERRRELAEKQLEEATERGQRQEEAARLHEEKVQREEAQWAEKRALAEKRKKARDEQDAIRQLKLQKRQEAKVEASDRQREKERRREERQFDEDELALEDEMRNHMRELEEQKAQKEQARRQEQAQIRSDMNVVARSSISEAMIKPTRKGHTSDLVAALKAARAEDVDGTLRALSAALEGGQLPKDADRVATELELLAADFVQRSAELTGSFVKESTNPDRDIARMMSKFFNETFALGREHDDHAYDLRLELLGALPEKARAAGMPLLMLLWPVPLHEPVLNFSAFRLSEDSGICGQVTLFNQAVDGFRANVTKVHQMLNYTAYLLPKLPHADPDASKQVAGFAENMLRLGYVEAIAREGEASKLRAAVTPAVLERLLCSGSQTDSSSRGWWR